MNRNQKIAIGCGGAGCLGLVVLMVVGIIGYMTYWKSSVPYNRNGNANYTNRNSNLDNSNANAADTNDSSTSSTMSDGDKHKLFQAAGITKDSDLILKVLAKIGYPSGTGSGYDAFVKDHFAWAMKNMDFMETVNTPEKGRAYVEEHLDD